MLCEWTKIAFCSIGAIDSMQPKYFNLNTPQSTKFVTCLLYVLLLNWWIAKSYNSSLLSPSMRWAEHLYAPHIHIRLNTLLQSHRHSSQFVNRCSAMKSRQKRKEKCVSLIKMLTFHFCVWSHKTNEMQLINVIWCSFLLFLCYFTINWQFDLKRHFT